MDKSRNLRTYDHPVSNSLLLYKMEGHSQKYLFGRSRKAPRDVHLCSCGLNEEGSLAHIMLDCINNQVLWHIFPQGLELKWGTLRMPSHKFYSLSSGTLLNNLNHAKLLFLSIMELLLIHILAIFTLQS